MSIQCTHVFRLNKTFKYNLLRNKSMWKCTSIQVLTLLEFVSQNLLIYITFVPNLSHTLKIV